MTTADDEGLFEFSLSRPRGSGMMSTNREMFCSGDAQQLSSKSPVNATRAQIRDMGRRRGDVVFELESLSISRSIDTTTWPLLAHRRCGGRLRPGLLVGSVPSPDPAASSVIAPLLVGLLRRWRWASSSRRSEARRPEQQYVV